jgi:hypothetical protein
MLGTTPNMGGTPGKPGVKSGSGSRRMQQPQQHTLSGAPRAAAAAAAAGGFFANFGPEMLLAAGAGGDEDDELMGMSPDVPSMIRGPHLNAMFMQQQDAPQQPGAPGPIASFLQAETTKAQ